MASRNDSGISVSFFLDQDLIVFKLNRIASLQFVHAILAFMRLIVRPIYTMVPGERRFRMRIMINFMEKLSVND
jgi:hypothetical protein